LRNSANHQTNKQTNTDEKITSLAKIIIVRRPYLRCLLELSRYARTRSVLYTDRVLCYTYWLYWCQLRRLRTQSSHVMHPAIRPLSTYDSSANKNNHTSAV